MKTTATLLTQAQYKKAVRRCTDLAERIAAAKARYGAPDAQEWAEAVRRRKESLNRGATH